MRKLLGVLLCTLLLGMASLAQAKIDIMDQFAEAMMTSDTTLLEKLLAPTFVYIGSNGHIYDKEHLLADLKNNQLNIDRLRLTNVRRSMYGTATVSTGNAEILGKQIHALPKGLQRYTMVVEEGKQGLKIVLFQMTPVIASKKCPDGNCANKQ